MKMRKKVRRIVAAMLSTTMLLNSLPMEILAAETISTDSNATLFEYEIDSDGNIINESKNADSSEEHDFENVDPGETLEVETPSNAQIFNDGKWSYDVIDGYAVITGYSDQEVERLDIPYKIDDYYVNGIGREAFISNKELEELYIHGNVINIAADAFDGLDITLQGYNGTTVLYYAVENDYAFENISDVEYLTFTDQVIDYSYTENYELMDEDTIKIGVPEAAQLNIGSIFYVPETLGDLLNAYEVVSMEEEDDWVIVDVKGADAEDALLSISMKDIELTADWENAQWADDVEVFEEKLGGSWGISASQNLSFKHKINKYVTFTGEGKLGISGKASVDYVVPTGTLNELKVITEPYLSFKGELKAAVGTDESKELKSKYESLGAEGAEFEIYLGSVPLVSVAKVVEVLAAVYVKVDLNGKITFTIKGSGEVGIQYNKNTEKFEGVNNWKFSKPTLEIDGNLAVGPVEALKLELAIIGEVVRVELFQGVTAKVAWSSKHTECFDADIGYLLYCSVKLQISLGKKLSANTELKIFEVEGHIDLLHYEVGKGLLASCTYKNSYKVDFVTFSSQNIDPQSVSHGGKIKEPELDENVGSKFEGWFTDKDFSTKWDFENDTVTEDLTLYANWGNSTRTVTYKVNYDKADFESDEVVGTVISQPSSPMWIDHVFEGWYKDAELTEPWDFNNDVMPDYDITLYGKWREEIGYDPYIINNVTSGEISYGGHTYTHFMTYLSFSEARAYCEKLGGYLMTITSAEEQEVIAEYVNADCAQTYLWLGINSAGNWKYWLNGEKVTYTNWEEGSDPGLNSVQYNGVMRRTTGEWTGIDNGQTAHFVCEWGAYVEDPAASFLDSAFNGVEYAADETNKTASVIGWVGDVEDIVISNTYNGYPVTSIAKEAFRDNAVIKSVVIPNTIVSIGEKAFYGCGGLTDIVLPSSVTDVGKAAFEYTSLESVVWSDKATVIPDYAFNQCTKLKRIENIENVTTIGNYAFPFCALENFQYPKALEYIGSYAFRDNDGITNGNIPDSVSYIGEYAFYDCDGLQTVTIPDSVTELKAYTFAHCDNLGTVYIPNSITSLKSTVFYKDNCTFMLHKDSSLITWCEENGYSYELIDNDKFRVRFVSGLSEGAYLEDQYVAYGKRIAEPDIESEGYILVGWYMDSAYTEQWDFINDVMPAYNITLYAKWAQAENCFDYIVSNEKATITGYKGSEANVVIPESLGGYPVSAIADGAMSSSVITNIFIPSTVVEIEDGAFGNAKNLYEIELEETSAFKTIDGVLYSADGKRLICAPQARTYVLYTVLEGTEEIGKRAFANHDELQKITIPETVTSISSDAFLGNYSLWMYGPEEDCVIKTFAQKYNYGYNIYKMSFYDGNSLIYQANVEAGHLVEDYYAPTSDFLSFGGWYKDANYTEEWDFETDFMPAENVNLYLKWNSDFSVLLVDDEIIITGYKGALENIIIPDTINGYAVTGIASGAFSGSTIKSITIPACIYEIVEGAFGDGVILIGDAGSVAQSYADNNGYTFAVRTYRVTFETLGGSYVESMEAIPGETLELPSSVRSNYYFGGWYENTNYADPWTSETEMPAHNVTLYALWRIANNNITDNFSYEVLNDGTAEITGYSGTKASVTIPETINDYIVTRIGEFAFNNNTTILTVTIPETVESIGEHAFSDSSVRVIKGGENLEVIENYAFSGVSALRTMELPETLREIGKGAFTNCTSMTEIVIPEGVETIGAKAFYGCKYLEEIEFPSTLKVIGSQAFINTRLSEVTIPSILKRSIEGVFDDNVIVNFEAGDELSILTLKQKTKTSVTLEWSAFEGAEGYYLYRKDGEDGVYKKIKTVKTLETGNYSLTPGTIYGYKIAAYDSYKNILAESEEVTITIAPFDIPVVRSVVQESASTAIMTLKALTGVDGYEIYRSDSFNDEYTLLKSITDITTVNSGLIGGGDYYYKVRAYVEEIDGSRSYSEWSEVYYFHMPYKFLTPPKNVVAYQSKATTITISWDAVDGANGYTLYRSVNGAAYQRVKNVVGTSTQNYNLEQGNTYSYKVKAYFYENGTMVSSEYSERAYLELAALVTPLIQNIEQRNSSTAIVQWNAVDGADGYALYRSLEKDGTYSWVKNVTDVKAENYNLTVGTTYYYKVRAYQVAEDGTKAYSAYSPAFAFTVNPLEAAEAISLEQISSTEVKFVWGTVTGAAGYEVWWCVNENGSYELKADVTEKSAVIPGLKDGNTYYYKVRGYAFEDGNRVYGDFSDAMSLKCIGSPCISVLEQSKENAVEIMWTRVNSAVGYELWRSVDGSEYQKVKTVMTNTTSNYNLTLESTYAYKVRAYCLNSEGQKVYGLYSEPIEVKILATPSISTIIQSDVDSVTLKWTKSAGAAGYSVFRSNLKDGIYSLISETTGRTIVDSGLDSGNNYYYKIVAYTEKEGVKKYSQESEIRYIGVLSTPEITDIEPLTANSVSLTWTAVENAVGYKVYRSNTEDGTYVCVKTVVGDTTVINRGMSSENTYYYKVAAYMEEENSVHIAMMSDVYKIYVTRMARPVISALEQSDENSVSLAWNQVSGAEGYKVFRSDSADGIYEAIGTINSVNETTYTDTELETGNKYYYKVCAFKTVDDMVVYSPYAIVMGALLVATPVIDRVDQASFTSAKITWNEVNNATGYKLYRADTADGPYEWIKTVKTTETTNYSLENGETYYYKVLAYVDNASEKNLGALSEAVAITISDLQPVKVTALNQNGNDSATIEWETSETADGYEVYMSVDANTTIELVDETDECSITVGDLTENQNYWFRIRAYKMIDGVRAYSSFTSIGEFYILTVPEIQYLYQAEDASVSAVWTNSEFAAGYEVARSADEENYQIVGDVSTTEFTERDLQNDTTYSYKVRAYMEIAGNRSYSEYSEITALKTIAMSVGEYPESEHNYTNNLDQTWTYTIPNAEALLLKFSSESATDSSLDKITITDGDGSAVGTYYGNIAGKYVLVVGDTVNIRFETNNWSVGYGFAFEFIASTNVNVETGTIGDVVWTLEGKVLTFSGEGEIDTTFKGNKEFTKVVLKEGITGINSYAFYNCTSLKEVEMTDTVTTIDAYTFYNCSSLTKITIPSTVTSIAGNVFGGTGLTTVGPVGGGYDLEYGWTESIPNYAFQSMAKLTEAVITDGIASIGTYAFDGCTNLEKVTLPSSLTSIGNYAFRNASSLNNVEIPEGTTTIGSRAFYNCSSLTKVTIPSTVTSISDYVFSGTGVTTAGPTGGGYGLEYGWTDSIPKYTFAGMKNLTDVVLSVGITSIGKDAFNGCTNLENIVLPSTLKSIGSYAFYGDSKLTSIEIPEGVTAIENSAFYNCSSLTKLKIPSTVTSIATNALYGIGVTTAGPTGGNYDYEYGWTESIPKYAFENISSLTEVVVAEGITNIDNYAFYNCKNLEKVILPSTLTIIGNYAFCASSKLNNVEIPAGVTSIGASAFYNCNGLTKIKVSATVTSVSDNAFYGIGAATAGPIGGEYDYEYGWTESIPKYAFGNISNLTEVVVAEGITNIDNYAFYNCKNLEKVTLPSTLTKIGNYAFNGSSKLNNVEIPTGVTSIGTGAFYNCSGLTKIKVPATVTSVSDNAFYGIGATTAGPIGGEYDYEYGWTETIPAYAMARIKSLKTVTIPDGVSAIGDYAFSYCSDITVIVPDSVLTISDKAFYGGSNITIQCSGSSYAAEYANTKGYTCVNP